MGHKYIKRDGTWDMSLKYGDSTTIIRACPKCGFAQPLDTRMLNIVDFSKCPKCNARLDIPKKVG